MHCAYGEFLIPIKIVIGGKSLKNKFSNLEVLPFNFYMGKTFRLLSKGWSYS